MNPLFLLLGMLGAGVFGAAAGSATATTVTTPSTLPDDADTDDGPGASPNTGSLIPTPSPSSPPATGGSETPSTGGSETPSTGGSETPSTGGSETPSTGGSGTPSTGGSGTPSTGGSETPAPLPGNSGSVTAPDQGGASSGGSDSTPITASNSVEVMAGRVATLEAMGEDVTDVRIVSGVEHGTITVNPDNTLALVLTKSEFTGSQNFTYEVTHSDGSTSLYETNLTVTPGAQAAGWGTGESQYMLATDADDRVVVEHGENHQKLYVSGSDDALTVAEIASMEGLSTSQITTEWLLASDYGKSEDLALHKDIGMDAWEALTPRSAEASNWLMLEKGYDYAFNGTELIGRYGGGESELHPTYIGAWGSGDLPEITSNILQQEVSNLVVQDVHFSGGLMILSSDNVLFDNIKVTEGGSAFMHSSGITVRNSDFLDNAPSAPAGDSWHVHVDRAAGVYMDTTDGALWDGNFFDANGWHLDWEETGGLPPSMFSHNMYLDAGIRDLTLRDTISMRGSSYGAQVRSGGFVEDNLFADNNAALNTVGGDYNGAGPVGHYTLFSGNVITHAAYEAASQIGALTQGLHDNAQMTSLVDNIVAHLSDPNADESWKIWNHGGLEVGDTAYYDDTVVWNWDSFRDSENVGRITEQNVDGLDQAVMNETTIQRFTQQLTGNPNATTADLAAYLRAQADGALDDVVDADLINRFFQQGFGVATDIRDSAQTVTFTPDDVGDGVRWDNRLNWDTEDLPGLFPEDDVDLGGNHVVFGDNATIDTLDLSGGALNIYGGRLETTGGLQDSGALNLEGAGQLWTDGSDGAALDIAIGDNARFVNTGEMSGADLTATGGQTILATDGGRYSIGEGHALTLEGGAARVGFDDDDGDLALFGLDGGTLAFEAGDGGLGEIGEFRSGAFGDSPDVQSGVDLGNGTLSINLAGLSAADGAAFQLLSADEIIGVFDEALIDGLGARDARVVVDYASDSVTLELSAGSGAISIETVGEESDISAGADALWTALTADHGVASETQAASLAEAEDDLIAAA